MAPRRTPAFLLVRKYSTLTFKSQSIFHYLKRYCVFLKRSSMLAQICFYVGQGDGVYPHFNKLWEFTISVVHYVSKESFTWNAPCLWLPRTCRPLVANKIGLLLHHQCRPCFLELSGGLNEQHSKKHLAKCLACCRLSWVEEAAAPTIFKIYLLYLQAFFDLQNYFCILSHQQYTDKSL